MLDRSGLKQYRIGITIIQNGLQEAELRPLFGWVEKHLGGTPPEDSPRGMTMFLPGGGTIINYRNDYKRYRSRRVAG